MAKIVTPPSCNGFVCTFDGSRSSDPDGTIVSYTWVFEGQGTASGSTAQHDFKAAGTYTVTLVVKDDKDATNPTQTTVTLN
jgi:PKD repeat protein